MLPYRSNSSPSSSMLRRLLALLHLLLLLRKVPLDAVLLDLVALRQRVPVGPCNAIALPVATVAVDPLDGPEPLPGPDVDGRRHERGVAGSRVEHDLSSRRVLGDLDLHVAQVALPRRPLALLLVGVVRLGRPRRAALHPAVPVVGDKGLALVALRRAVRVDVVHVGEVRLELLVGKDDHLIYIEQAFPPRVEARGVDDHPAGQMARSFAYGSGVQSGSDSLTGECVMVWHCGGRQDAKLAAAGCVGGAAMPNAVLLLQGRVSCLLAMLRVRMSMGMLVYE